MKDQKDIVKLIFSHEWSFGFERRMTYQKARMFSYAYQGEIPKIFGVKLEFELYRFKNSISSEYVETKEYNSALVEFERKFADIKSTELILKLVEIIKSRYTNFINYVNKMPTSYTDFSEKNLQSAYKNFCKCEKEISLPSWLLFLTFEEPLTNAIKKVFAEKAKNILENMSHPSVMTPLDTYNFELYGIFLKLETDQNELLNKFYNKYIHWGLYDVNYEEMEKTTFLKNISKILVEDVKTLRSDIKDKYKFQSLKKKKILDQWKNDKHKHALLTLYSLYADFKDWKNYYREQSSYKLKILLTEIAKRTNLSLEQISFLTEVEIINALKSKIILSPSEIDKRINNSLFANIKGKLHIITDSNLLNKIDNAISVDISTVKGAGAYLGVARGIVKVIISSDDFYKVNEGDIFVTSATRPDYLPIMQKSVAFITNEGGLLSHAAIMARELKKPCIIGTKIATKVLKDGDEVEVDANRGVVTIIKRASEK